MVQLYSDYTWVDQLLQLKLEGIRYIAQINQMNLGFFLVDLKTRCLLLQYWSKEMQL